jgi:RimJ/RimL family protein N-acetyltransferase
MVPFVSHASTCSGWGVPISFEDCELDAPDETSTRGVGGAACGSVTGRLDLPAEIHPTPEMLDCQPLIVRQIRAEDRALLAREFEHLSDESRRRRFCGAKSSLSPGELRYFTEVDHNDHEALVALTRDERQMVGMAQYVRYADRPNVAELAVLVPDAWQRRGIGTSLLSLLGRRAKAAGVSRFSACCLAENRPALGLLTGHGLRIAAQHRGIVDLEGPVGDSLVSDRGAGSARHRRAVAQRAAGHAPRREATCGDLGGASRSLHESPAGGEAVATLIRRRIGAMYDALMGAARTSP